MQKILTERIKQVQVKGGLGSLSIMPPPPGPPVWPPHGYLPLNLCDLFLHEFECWRWRRLSIIMRGSSWVKFSMGWTGSIGEGWVVGAEPWEWVERRQLTATQLLVQGPNRRPLLLLLLLYQLNLEFLLFLFIQRLFALLFFRYFQATFLSWKFISGYCDVE